jgi:DNA-binding PadR family transcriptional regulator
MAAVRANGRTIIGRMPKPSTKSKSQHVDKRSRTDLELFVLAMIDLGVNNPYALHSSYGVSPGASIPVLARLERSGYVRCGKSGARRRSEYEITPKGGRYLKEGWVPLLQSPAPQEMESILRIVILAIMAGADLKKVAWYANKAASEKMRESNQRKGEAERIHLSYYENFDPSVYPLLLKRYTGARLSTESKFLRELAKRLLLAS